MRRQDMFKVLYAPFPEALAVSEGAHAVLVKEEGGMLEILIQSIARDTSAQAENSGKFELAAWCLNNASDADRTWMLKSLERVWQESVAARDRQVASRNRPEHFGADFGRLDPSSPGQGGTGVDSYW